MQCGSKTDADLQDYCGDGEGWCACPTDLCNAPVTTTTTTTTTENSAVSPGNSAARPGMTTATYALLLFSAVAKYIFA